MFARRLKEVRIKKGFSTARSLASALSIDENRYTRYERAEVEPDLHLIGRMCHVLGVLPNDLLRVASDAPAYGNGIAGEPNQASISDPVQGLAQGGLLGHGMSPLDSLAWKLGCLVARVKAAGSDGDGTGNGRGESLTYLRTATLHYRELCRNPFSAIGDIVQDPAVLGANAATQQQINALCLQVAEARSSN